MHRILLVLPRDVIREPVYLVGNSLGGYVAASVAAQHSSLCRGVCFLNATPFWAFSPAASGEGSVAASSAAASAAARASAITAGPVQGGCENAVHRFSVAMEASTEGLPSQHAASIDSNSNSSSEVSDCHLLSDGRSLPIGAASNVSPSPAGGLMPPPHSSTESLRRLSLNGWDGALPAPPWMMRLLAMIWAQLQRPATIKRTLSQARHWMRLHVTVLSSWQQH